MRVYERKMIASTGTTRMMLTLPTLLFFVGYAVVRVFKNNVLVRTEWRRSKFQSGDKRVVLCNGHENHGIPYVLSMEDWMKQGTNHTRSLCDPLFLPSNTVANISKPVKVFILMGQSNMVGMANVAGDKNGTLEYTVKRKHRFTHLVDKTGNWGTRHDARYVFMLGTFGRLTNNEWLTVKAPRFGPEVQFGYIMAELMDEPVLLLKSCIGNRALGWDLLPPGSERYEFEGNTYAAYGESPDKWPSNTSKPTPQPNPWYAGLEYDVDVKSAKDVLANLSSYYPLATEGNYEITGFLWWQGDRDRRVHAYAMNYEKNLVQLIKQLRREFESPNAKFALATVGMQGYNMTGDTLAVAEAQLAVSGDRGKYPEFEGNVLSVDIRSSYREGDYHYGNNAETYQEVANGLGLVMAKMLFPGDRKDFSMSSSTRQS
jgi:hypothetical protein